MITKELLKEFAKRKGLRTEEKHPKTTLYRIKNKVYPDLCESEYHWYFGIELQKNVWFWWGHFVFDLTDYDSPLYFEERYNCMIGHSIKGIRTGINQEIKIKSYLQTI